jgi:hypothetical protein
VAVTTLEARGQILTGLTDAIDQLALATACLGEAYEQLDDASAERLEADLFRPVQRAYGRAMRTRAQFADRFGLVEPALESPSPGVASQGVKLFVSRAVSASAEADRGIAELQDSMLPVEAGDAELRTGLAEVRELVDGLPMRAREFVRALGR